MVISAGSVGRKDNHVSDGRLRWQCKRGMRELDELLTRYLGSTYERAAETEKAAFRELLELPNPALIGYLLGRQVIEDPVLSDLVNKIRRLRFP